jgi:hypothetical protein
MVKQGLRRACFKNEVYKWSMGHRPVACAKKTRNVLQFRPLYSFSSFTGPQLLVMLYW